MSFSRSLSPLPSFISVGQHVDGLQLDALRSCVCICRSRPRAHDSKPWERQKTAVLCNASVYAQQHSLSGHVEQSSGEWEGPARGRGHTSDSATHARSGTGRAECLIKKRKKEKKATTACLWLDKLSFHYCKSMRICVSEFFFFQVINSPKDICAKKYD